MSRIYSLTIFSLFFLWLFLPTKNNVFAQSSQAVQTAVGIPAQGGGGNTGGNVHFYCQYGKVNANGVLTDSEYWNTPTCNIKGYGCGPTSIAMIMTTQGVTKTPTEVAIGGNKQGCGGPYGGTTASEVKNDFAPYLRNNGFTITGNLVSGGNLNIDSVKKFLDSGYLILGGALMRYNSGGYKLGGHAFVLSGYKNGSVDDFIAYDPTFCTRSATGGERVLDDVNNSTLSGNDNVETWYYAFAIKKL